MFGNKQEKQERLDQLMDLLEGEELSAAQIARKLGVHRSTVSDDLLALHERGDMLQEDDGKISIFRRKK